MRGRAEIQHRRDEDDSIDQVGARRHHMRGDRRTDGVTEDRGGTRKADRLDELDDLSREEIERVLDVWTIRQTVTEEVEAQRPGAATVRPYGRNMNNDEPRYADLFTLQAAAYTEATPLRAKPPARSALPRR